MMEKTLNPLVSIILLVYNHEKYVREAIQSVLDQTYTDFELIIVDDGSSDNSANIIKSFNDDRITIILNEVNTGGVLSLNQAIQSVKTDLIAIHHSDDTWAPTKLAKQVEFLKDNPDVGAVFSRASIIDEDGNRFTGRDHYYYKIFDQKNRSRFEWLRHFFIHGGCLCHPSVLIRKECYQKVGMYDPRLAQLPDLDIWIRLCLSYEIHVLPEKLVRFRVRAGEANTSGDNAGNRTRLQFEYSQILKHFHMIHSFEELVNIFPEANEYKRDKGGDIDFALAMSVLDLKPHPFAQYFALNILFELVGAPDRSAIIKKIYNFDEKRFVELSGQFDAFSQEKISRLKNRYESQVRRMVGAMESDRRAFERLKNNHELLLESTSWKVTSPLRITSAYIRKLKTLTKAILFLIRKHKGFLTVLSLLWSAFSNKGITGVRSFLTEAAEQRLVYKERKPLPLSTEAKVSTIPFYVAPEIDQSDVKEFDSCSIGIHIHLFYPEMLDEFASRLKAYDARFDLFVSVPEGSVVEEIRNGINNLMPLCNEVIVEAVPNRGRDIAPLIIQFGERLKQYELIGHFHTKRSPHVQGNKIWSKNILDCLLGEQGNRGGRIAHFVNMLQTEAKVIYAEGTRQIIKDHRGWAGNYSLAKEVLDNYSDIQISNFPMVEFPEGSMFWARAECLKEFLSLPFQYEAFPEEPIPADGTLAHALERLILIFACKHSGHCYRIHKSDSISDYRHYEGQIDFSTSIIHRDVKVLSFYLPQFHPIPENDRWHGKGFTEWTKVRAANPLFEGHYQQHIPHEDIGYYLLDSPDVLKKQALMMKRAGVHGQVFYHYWFSGKLILEGPARMLLENPDVDMPFCFCWANENWTKKWDGNEDEILLAQNYSPGDARAFIQYLIPYFRDSRYIKVEDRPVLYVYRPSSITNIEEYIDIWREECAAQGVNAPYLVAVLTRGATHPSDFGMDAGVERVLHDWTAGGVQGIKKELRAYREMGGSVLPYDKVADFYSAQDDIKGFTYFRSIVPMWDNTARYGSEAIMLHGSTPKRFQEWLESIIRYARKTLPEDRRFVLVNAWNEWAEAAHLEPDSRYGYSYLNAVGRSLSCIDYSEGFNPAVVLDSKKRLKLVFSEHIRKQLESDEELRVRFLSCINHSTVTGVCEVYCDEPGGVAEGLADLKSASSEEMDYILEFRNVAFFGPQVIEKMLMTAQESPESIVVSNAYNRHIVALRSGLTENGSVDSMVADSSPLILFPDNVYVTGHKNVRMRSDAHCFVTYPSTMDAGDKPVVTTIIRFHKSGSFSLLEKALYSLSAMQGTVVLPLIAAQDLNSLQKQELEKILENVPFASGVVPEVVYYKTPGGEGDRRSEMLNKSLLHVRTQYAAFLDYDDLLMPDAYGWLIERLNKTGKAVSFGRIFEMTYNEKTGEYLKRSRSYEFGNSYDDFLHLNHAPLHSFMLDLSKLDLENIRYFGDQKYMEDYLLTLQVFTKENADWEGLRANRYIGDYICCLGKDHTLAIPNKEGRIRLQYDDEYMVCEKRVQDMRRSLKRNTRA